MQVLIRGHSYRFSGDVLPQSKTRKSYFKLAQKVFGLNFDTWYQSGHWDDKFIPYVLYDGDMAVSSIAVCVNDITGENETKRYVQLSTVMTLPRYRNKGLNRWLMEHVLQEWDEKCDAIYLLANDSVVDFYPKFRFEKFTEYDFTMPIANAKGEYRKLNINNPDDFNLIKRHYELSNPFSRLNVQNFGFFMFHCLYSHAKHIYYIEQYDAVIIAEHNENKIICYEILAPSHAQLSDLLGVLAKKNTEVAVLGFTPKTTENCLVAKSQEKDTHLFVLAGKENVFKGNEIMFPLLSRA